MAVIRLISPIKYQPKAPELNKWSLLRVRPTHKCVDLVADALVYSWAQAIEIGGEDIKTTRPYVL